MYERQNHEKEKNHKASIDGLEVVVIQIFIYVRVPLIVGATKQPINYGEGEVNQHV